MKCPACKSATGGYYSPPTQRDDAKEELVKQGLMDPKALRTEWEDMPLYQRSFPGEPEHISPRCFSCYNKAERKAERKLLRRKANV